MLREYLRKLFAREFYPTKSTDWYKNKGYVGANMEERFADFVSSQKQSGAIFYHEFQELQLSRHIIASGGEKLDSVLITPEQSISYGKPGDGLYFIMFQGRGEYYESRFRDMARQAQETGASVVGFNPKGFCSSTGATKTLADIVDDGVAVIDFLLKRGVSNNQIILQGNSLGGAVIDMVDQHYRANKNMRFRQINSNSFKNLGAVVADHASRPYLEFFYSFLLKISGWEISTGSDFYQTGPYRCCLYRHGDKTIKLKAEYHSGVDYEKDYKLSPEPYRATHKWLNEHSQLIYTGKSDKNPHNMSLSVFKIKEEVNGKKRSVYFLINRYLEASNAALGV